MNTILYTIIEQIKDISILLNPIMPDATNKILDILNIESEDINLNNLRQKNSLNFDKKLKKISILFKKIENDN